MIMYFVLDQVTEETIAMTTKIEIAEKIQTITDTPTVVRKSYTN